LYWNKIYSYIADNYWLTYVHLDDARAGRGHVTFASAVMSRFSAVTQQKKHCGLPRVRSRVYRRDWSSFTVSSWLFLGWEWEASMLIREVYAVTVLIQVSSRREVRSWRRPERVSSCQLSERIIVVMRIPQFKLVLGVSCEECCEEKIYM
jgi:hypothetical protein